MIHLVKDMIKLGEKLRVSGASGKEYFFEKYFIHRAFKPHFEAEKGIYLFLKKKNNGKYDPIYAGQTDQLHECINRRDKGNCVVKCRPNRVCILNEPLETMRKNVLEDILANEKYEFSCNNLI